MNSRTQFDNGSEEALAPDIRGAHRKEVHGHFQQANAKLSNFNSPAIYCKIFPRYSDTGINSPKIDDPDPLSCVSFNLDGYSERDVSMEDYLYYLSGKDIFTYLQDGLKNFMLSNPNPMTASHMIYEQIHLIEKQNAIQIQTQGLPGQGTIPIHNSSSALSDGLVESNVPKSNPGGKQAIANDTPSFLNSVLKGDFHNHGNLNAKLGILSLTNQNRNISGSSQSKNYQFNNVNTNLTTEHKYLDPDKYRLHLFSYLKVYLQHAFEGKHIVNRDYSFISSTMYNRHCFILSIEEKYPSSLQCQVNVTIRDLHALLLQLCPDFPSLTHSPIYSKLRFLPNFNISYNTTDGVLMPNDNSAKELNNLSSSVINDDAETSLLTLMRAFYIAFYFQEYLEAAIRIFQQYNSTPEAKGKDSTWIPSQNSTIITTEVLLNHLESLSSNSKLKGEKYLPMDVLKSILFTARCHEHKYITLKMFIGSILNSSVLAKTLCMGKKPYLRSSYSRKDSNCYTFVKEEINKVSDEYAIRKRNDESANEYLGNKNKLKKMINQKSLELIEEQETQQQSYLYNILNFNIDGVNNKDKEVATSKETLNSCINIDLVNIDIGKYNLLGKRNISVASTSRRMNPFNNSSSCNNQGNVSLSSGSANKKKTKR